MRGLLNKTAALIKQRKDIRNRYLIYNYFLLFSVAQRTRLSFSSNPVETSTSP